MHIGLRVLCRFLWSDFNQNWIFSKEFPKIRKYQVSWISVLWQPNCSNRTDEQAAGRQTDRHMTKLIVPFLLFCMCVKLGRWYCGRKESWGCLRTWCWGEYLDLGRTRERGNGGDCITGAKWFVLLTQYCAGDKIEKNEMGWACGAYGWGEGGV